MTKDKKYYQNNRLKKRVYNEQKTPDQRNAPGAYSVQEIINCFNEQSAFCYYCYADITNRFSITFKIPLSRGGTKNIENIVLTCKRCKLEKGDKTEQEWSIRHYLLTDEQKKIKRYYVRNKVKNRLKTWLLPHLATIESVDTYLLTDQELAYYWEGWCAFCLRGRSCEFLDTKIKRQIPLCPNCLLSLRKSRKGLADWLIRTFPEQELVMLVKRIYLYVIRDFRNG